MNKLKITEFGDIPDGWDIRPLKDVHKGKNKLINPLSFPSEIFELYSIPAYYETKKPELKSGRLIQSTKFLIEKDTILFGKINPRNPKVWKVTIKENNRKIASTEFIPVSPNQETSFEFLFQLLNSDAIIEKSKTLISGTTPSRARIEPRRFYDLLIPIPPLKEQQKIASILSNVDLLIQKTDQIIEHTKILKKGLMQRLLTKGIGHTKFKEITLFPRYNTETIPESWHVEKVSDLIKIIDYRGRTPPFADNGILHLRSNNIRDGKIVFEEVTYVSEQTYDEYMTRGIPQENDVLFTTEGPLGEVALVPKNFKFSLAQRLIVLRPKIRILLPQFLKWILLDRKVRSRYFGLSTGTTLEGIASKWFTKLFIPYPNTLEEQIKIYTVLEEIEKNITHYQNTKKRYEFLKKGLMQQLLTGKIRVKV